MSETISRFVYTMTDGKVVTNYKKALEARERKIQAALSEMEAQIGRLQASGIRSRALDGIYERLRAAHALALLSPNDADRYRALGEVKEDACKNAETAKKVVEQTLKRAAMLAHKSSTALTAILSAEKKVDDQPLPDGV
jgi:hypothetical protein